MRLQSLLAKLTDHELQELEWETASGGPLNEGTRTPTPWARVARAEQLLPEELERDKLVWLILAGRGWGKTRTGAEWARQKAREMPGSRGAFVAKDPAEARNVMVEGVSGIVAVSPAWFRPTYNPSLKRLTWPNGAQATVYSSEDYDELRGPQHHWAWADELPKWRNASQTWEQLQFGLRLGQRPQACITSTPRPIKILREVMRDPLTHVTRGTTYDNLSNLSPFYQSIIRKFEGTRLGRQELRAEILDDVPGALWTYSLLDKFRLWQLPPAVHLARAVVGVDPSASEEGNEAGIIAGARGSDGRGYLLADRTLQGRPEAWAKAAVDLFEEIGADHIVAEQNNGGQMVESVITAYARSIGKSVPVRLVTASRGKITRAEPIALLYENGTISHLGSFPELEDEMCTYQETDVRGAKQQSPNRMDACVWTFTDLFDKAVADLRQAFFGSRVLTSARGAVLGGD